MMVEIECTNGLSNGLNISSRQSETIGQVSMMYCAWVRFLKRIDKDSGFGRSATPLDEMEDGSVCDIPQLG